MDTAVGSTAAEIPCEAMGNFCVVALLISVQKGFGGDGEPWRAEPALLRVIVNEGKLDRMRPLAPAQTFGRDNLFALRFDGECGA